ASDRPTFGSHHHPIPHIMVIIQRFFVLTIFTLVGSWSIAQSSQDLADSVCDSMSFETSGLSTEFHRTRNISRCLKPSSGIVVFKLYDENDSLDAVFSVAGNDTIFGLTNSMGSFPGGEGEMMRFMGRQIKYPSRAIDAGISGIVYVNFTIEMDGSITNMEILRSPHELLTEEAIKMIRQMPHWTPATYYGRVVRSRYNLPVKFTLR